MIMDSIEKKVQENTAGIEPGYSNESKNVHFLHSSKVDHNNPIHIDIET